MLPKILFQIICALCKSHAFASSSWDFCRSVRPTPFKSKSVPKLMLLRMCFIATYYVFYKREVEGSVQLTTVVEAKKQTFSSFDELITNSDKPVLVDFYATWCGPCQLMVPILEKASDALKDKIQVVKIDTEKYPALANEYKIEALPTFILFKNGKPFDRFEGALPAEKLVQRIEDSLAVKS